MESLTDYSYPVHRSIMKRRLLFGVPFIPAMIVILLAGIIFMDFKLIAVIPIAIFIIYVMKEITKKDEYLLETFLEGLLQPDNLI